MIIQLRGPPLPASFVVVDPVVDLVVVESGSRSTTRTTTTRSRARQPVSLP
jgi:hypothetical protein